jgi:hypothetical protein
MLTEFYSRLTRGRAFFLHLALSLLLLLPALYVVGVYWYPPPFFGADGGWQGFRNIAGVALVLGPLLTLVVFKPGKKGLTVALIVIAVLQLSTLIAGVVIAWREHPVAIVYTQGYVTPVPRYQLRQAGLNPGDLGRFGTRKPRLIYVDIPDDLEGRQSLYAQSLSSGVPLYLFVHRYQIVTPAIKQKMLRSSRELLAWLETDPAGKRELDAFYQIRPELYDYYLFLPLHSRYLRKVMVLRLHDLSYAGSLDVDVTPYFKNRIPPFEKDLRDAATRSGI